MTFQIVVATTRQGGIGTGGALPWHLPGDMNHFRQLTTQTNDATKINAVIMGRTTWESLPPKFRPLPKRVNVVLTRTNVDIEGVCVAHSLDAALKLLSADPLVETVFVIGGGQVYEESMRSPYLSAIHVTRVESDIPCDTFMPPVDDEQFTLRTAGPPQQDRPDGPRYSYATYCRRTAKR